MSDPSRASLTQVLVTAALDKVGLLLLIIDNKVRSQGSVRLQLSGAPT